METREILVGLLILLLLWFFFFSGSKRFPRVRKNLRREIKYARGCHTKPPFGYRGAYCQDGKWLYTCPDVEHSADAHCDMKTGTWKTSSGCDDATGDDTKVCVETERGSKWIDMIQIPNDTGTDGDLTPQYRTPLILNP